MIQLLVVANNRPDYLAKTLTSVAKYLPGMDPIVQNDTYNVGMARNIAEGWTRALEREWDYLLHWEDDMELLDYLPLEAAIKALESRPHVANMIFKRQPWSAVEWEIGCVHETIKREAPNYVNHGTWGEHDHIFSLNPCLIPRRIVERGWPSGPLGIGNEAGMTARLLADGYTFGVWGQPFDKPLIDHIGHERGPGWKL